MPLLRPRPRQASLQLPAAAAPSALSLKEALLAVKWVSAIETGDSAPVSWIRKQIALKKKCPFHRLDALSDASLTDDDCRRGEKERPSHATWLWASDPISTCPGRTDGRTGRLRSLLSLSPLFCRRHRRRRLESPVKRLHIVKRVILRYRSCKKHTESQFGKGRRGGREGGFKVRQKSSSVASLSLRQINLTSG